jgi:hypothetical protein
MPFIRALSGKLIKVPEGLSDDEALDLAKSKFPKEFADTRKAEEGLIPSIKSGAIGLGSQYATAAAPLLGLSEEQTRRMTAKDEARQMETAKTPSWEDTKEAFANYGVFGGDKADERGGLGQLLRMWRGQLGESLPQMGATMAGARIGAGAGAVAAPFLGPAAPVAPLIGGALGALGANIPAFTGANVQRQIAEQEKAGVRQPLEYGKAVAAAAPAAALDVAETAFVLGRLGMGKLFTKSLEGVAAKVGVEKAEDVLKATAQRSLLGTAARGAGRGVAVEMPTEIAQAVLERAQAGLDLFDADARKEYEATAAGVAGPGAVFGVAGGISGRSAARDKVQELEDQRAQQAASEAKKKQDAEEAALAQVRQSNLAKTEEGFAPEGQGRLFGGEATPLPISGNMQQLFQQLKEAEAKGDTQTASQLRNDMQRLQSELQDPEALAQRRQQLQDARDGITEKIQALAGKDPAGIKELRQQGAAITQEIKRVDALLAQAPVQPSPEQAAKKLQALTKQLEKAKAEGDEDKMDSLTDKVVAMRSFTDQTGDLLAGVQQTGESSSERTARLQRSDEEQVAAPMAAANQSRMFAEDVMAQMEDAQQERARIAKEQQQQRAEDADNEVAAARVEALAKKDPLKAIIFGRGVSVGNLDTLQERLDKLQQRIDSGRITAKVASLLSLPRVSFDLNNPNQAERALPVLEQRIRELTAERKTEFPSKDLFKNGVITKDGQRLVALDATVSELKRLQVAAQNTMQKSGFSPAEAGFVGALEATTGRNESIADEKEKREAAAIKRATDINKFAEQRKTQMFNWGNEIDSLRKGDDKNDVSRKAAELRAEQVALLARMEAVKRVQQMGAEMGTSAQERLENEVKLWLSRITKDAQPPVGPDTTLSDVRQVPQGPIDRGMAEGELARLQEGVDRLINNAVEKLKPTKPKKKVGPFGLTQPSAAVLSKRYDEQQAAAEPEVAPEPDLSGKQREMFPGSITEVTKKKQANEKRAATIAAKKQGQQKETTTLIQQVARNKRAGAFFKKVRQEKRKAYAQNAEARLNSLTVLEANLEKEIKETKEAQNYSPLLANMEFTAGLTQKQIDKIANATKTAQTAKITLKDFSSLGELTNVEFSGNTAYYLERLEAQLKDVRSALEKTKEKIETDKRKAEDEARRIANKDKEARRVPAGQVKAPEETRPPVKQETAEDKAERLAREEMRSRVEQQFDFVAETQAAIAAEEQRIENQIKGEWLASDAAKAIYEEDPLYNSLLDNMEYQAGLTPKQLKKIENQVREKAAEYRSGFAENIIRTNAYKRRLTRDNAALQKLKSDLEVFEGYLKQLTQQENLLRTQAQLKPLKQQVKGYLDRLEKLVKNGQERDVKVGKEANAQLRGVKDVLDDIAQGKIKGQRGVRTEQVATTLSANAQGRIKQLEEKQDALGNSVKDRRGWAELQQQIEQVRSGANALVKKPFVVKEEVSSDISKLYSKMEGSYAAAKSEARDERLLAIKRARTELAARAVKAEIYRPLIKTIPALEEAVKKADLLLKEARTTSEKIYRKKALRAADNELTYAKEIQSLLEGKDAERLASMTKALQDAGIPVDGDAAENVVSQVRLQREMTAAERRDGRRTPADFKTRTAGYEPEFTTKRGSVDLEGLGQQRRAGNDPDARDATDADTGVNPAAAKAVADRVQAALPEGVEFIYAPTLADAPADLRAFITRTGRKAVKGAVMPDGRVVVIGEAHSSPKDVEETIAHELIGHYGADMVLGPEGMKAMVADMTKKGLDHVAEVATGLGVFPDVATARMAMPKNVDEKVMTVLVREMIAHAAEGRRVAPRFAEKVKTFIRDLISKVRGFFRNAGLSSLARADTKAIQKILNDAEKALSSGRVGVYRTPDGETVFRTDAAKPEGMPDKLWNMQQQLVGNKKKPLLDRVLSNLTGIGGMTQFVDRFTPVKMAAKIGVEKGTLSDLEAMQNLYHLSNHGKRMNYTRDIAEHGPRELVEQTENGEKFWMVRAKEGDQPNLVKMFSALDKSGLSPEQYEGMFTLFLASQRIKNEGVGANKLNYGKDAAGNPLVTDASLKEFEDYIKSQKQVADAFAEARAIYNEYNKGLIDFAVQSGALSKELGAALKKKKDYIPFYREDAGKYELVLDDETSPIVIGNIKDQPYLQELVGGDQRILPIFMSAVQNTQMLTDIALRNIATKDTAFLLAKMGMADKIRPGLGGAGPDILRFKVDGEDRHIQVQTKGTIYEDVPAELLVKGMEGVKTTFPAALELLGAPAKLLRRFIVLSPLYPIRQIIRDSFSALGTSGANFVPVYGPLKEVAKAMAGNSDTAKRLQSEGFGGGQLLAGTDTEGMSTILRSVASGKTTAGSLLAWAEAKSMLADTGLRAAAYDSFRKQGLNSLRAWIATNEIIDFNRQGLSPSTYVANTLIPFFNTQIQGLSVIGRAMSGRMPMNEKLRIQEKFYKRGMGLAAMTLMYAALMQDDEAYQNASPEARLANWFLRIPGVDEPVKIPIPFEYGLLFKAIPETLFAAAGQDSDMGPVMKALGKMALNSIPGGSSYMLPQAAKPLVELVTGVDMFTGNEIETPAMKKLDPAERYREDTSELAKMLGSFGGMSPVRIDQFIKSVGSQTALSLVSLTNPLLAGDNPPSASMKTSKLPLIGAAFQATDSGGVINRVYEQMEEAVQAKNTYTKLLEEGREEKAERYLNENLNRIMMADSAASFRNEMNQLTSYEKAIRADRNMSPEEKRTELDEVRRLKIETAKQYRAALRDAA